MDKIVEILDNAKAIRISMLDDIYPYIVPCRECCVAREEKPLNLVKMLDFDLSFTHFSFIRNKDGYLDKKINQTIPVEVFYYVVCIQIK